MKTLPLPAKRALLSARQTLGISGAMATMNYDRVLIGDYARLLQKVCGQQSYERDVRALIKRAAESTRQYADMLREFNPPHSALDYLEETAKKLDALAETPCED